MADMQRQSPLTPGALGPFFLETMGRPGVLRCTRQGLAVQAWTKKAVRTQPWQLKVPSEALELYHRGDKSWGAQVSPMEC